MCGSTLRLIVQRQSRAGFYGGKILLLNALAHRRNRARAPTSRQALWSCRVNIKHSWIAGILIPVVLVSGWSYSRVDMDDLRASYAISPDAVIMFSKSDCGSICAEHVAKISEAGIEVVPLDINDGTAGSHLWQALGGGNGPFPAFLVAGADSLQNTGGESALKLAGQEY